jgi:TldD protein
MRFCLLTASLLHAADPPGAGVLKAMKTELDRSMREFQKQPVPTYYLSYEVTETATTRVASSFGTLSASTADRRRELDIDLRVGDYAIDNTHKIRGSMDPFMDLVLGGGSIPVPLDDDAAAIRALLWYHTDQRYRRAVERLKSIQTNLKTKTENTDKAGDFSKAPAVQALEPYSLPPSLDRSAWEAKVRKYTEPFRRFGNIYQATADLSFTQETRWFVSSDGTSVQTVQPFYRLSINAWGKASDGMELPRSEQFFASTLASLPDDATVLKTVEKLIDDLKALKNAPVMDAYVGPAILSGKAAGVFFHEIFGHRMEAQRQKDEDDQHTFRGKVGQQILPPFMSVHSDATLKKLGPLELAGHYRFDNQGVAARRVTLVENGILKNFLMSRTPVDGFPESNGHGRKQAGFPAEARQSNLLITTSQPTPHAQMRQLLLAEVKRLNLPYGLIFAEIQGGFTNTMRGGISGFSVIPTMVYRLYADGREELVRGVDLVGTPLTSFSKISATDDQPVTFNGICGAPSGSIPVSAAAPGLLVTQIEVQKKSKSQETSPILAPPFDDK